MKFVKENLVVKKGFNVEHYWQGVEKKLICRQHDFNVILTLFQQTLVQYY